MYLNLVFNNKFYLFNISESESTLVLNIVYYGVGQLIQ